MSHKGMTWPSILGWLCQPEPRPGRPSTHGNIPDLGYPQEEPRSHEPTLGTKGEAKGNHVRGFLFWEVTSFPFKPTEKYKWVPSKRTHPFPSICLRPLDKHICSSDSSDGFQLKPTRENHTVLTVLSSDSQPLFFLVSHLSWVKFGHLAKKRKTDGWDPKGVPQSSAAEGRRRASPWTAARRPPLSSAGLRCGAAAERPAPRRWTCTCRFFGGGGGGV